MRFGKVDVGRNSKVGAIRSDGRRQGPATYWGYQLNPVWDNGLHPWGIWPFGIWIPIFGIGVM
jgi:hypothetical protein